MRGRKSKRDVGALGEMMATSNREGFSSIISYGAIPNGNGQLVVIFSEKKERKKEKKPHDSQHCCNLFLKFYGLRQDVLIFLRILRTDLRV